MLDEIDAAEKINEFVVVDLEGTANLTVAYGIAKADLVIVPSQRSTLDAGEAAKAFGLVKQQERVTGKDIPVTLLLTRTSKAIRTKGLKRMLSSMENNAVDCFMTEMYEREAFKAVFDYASTLYQLKESEISGLAKARENSAEFAAEVLTRISKNLAAGKQKKKELIK